MRIEIGKFHHTVSRREVAFGTLFGTGVFVIGRKAIAEEMTREHTRQQEESERLQKLKENIGNNYVSGEGSQVFQDKEAYSH